MSEAPDLYRIHRVVRFGNVVSLASGCLLLGRAPTLTPWLIAAIVLLFVLGILLKWVSSELIRLRQFHENLIRRDYVIDVLPGTVVKVNVQLKWDENQRLN